MSNMYAEHTIYFLSQTHSPPAPTPLVLPSDINSSLVHRYACRTKVVEVECLEGYAIPIRLHPGLFSHVRGPSVKAHETGFVEVVE